jgi:hypothetical protein
LRAQSKKLIETVAGIFEQDRVAIEAVHETMKRNRGRGVVHLQADKGRTSRDAWSRSAWRSSRADSVGRQSVTLSSTLLGCE